MPSTKNPFPGMNPYLEQTWPDVHTRLIGYIADSMGSQLPTGLIARSEEAVAVDDVEAGRSQSLRVDVGVVESWRLGAPPQWNPTEHTGPGGIVAAEPEILTVEPEPARWVEIRTPAGKVVTIIEVISPSNRIGFGRDRYRQRQHGVLESDASLVEIDLLRAGVPVLAAPTDLLPPRPGTHYTVCAYRALTVRREIYRCPLRERLPAVSIPLRETDRDAVLDLQPLIDRCYELGGYWQGDYRGDPIPPLPSDENTWLDERLRAAGLR